jgi:hypothetical protein
VVERVEMVYTDSNTQLKYQLARVFVRPKRRLAGHPIMPLELPSDAVERGLTAAIFPVNLLALLVLDGYRRWFDLFRRLRREAPAFFRADQRARRVLQKQAKHHFIRIQSLILRLAGGGIPEPIDDQPVEPRARPPRHLRLVPEPEHID